MNKGTITWLLSGKTLVTALSMAIALATPLCAQEDDWDEASKINTNIGMSWTVPLNPTARFINYGWGIFTVGAGYNFSQRHALVGEFMWNSLYPNNELIAPLRVALKSTNVKAHANVFSLTMNYRYELLGEKGGMYFIAGGGLYYRNSHVTNSVITSDTIACTPTWLWWGFACSSGIVSTDQTLASSSSGVFGVNGGIGFTARVGEPRYRMYVEARYHYAPNRTFSTQMIPITVGIRF